MRQTQKHLRQGTPVRRSLTSLAVLVAVVATTTAAAGGATLLTTDGKVDICHATTSNNNPYVLNEPDKSGDVSGHGDHTGPVWDPTLKSLKITWGDIIPPFDYDNDGTTAHYPGLNWTLAGQAIHAAGCNTPPPVLALTVVKTNDADGDGAFSDDETATASGATVSFRVAVTNTSAVPVVVSGITDVVGVTALPVVCGFVGTTLAAGASTACTFSLTGYTPADGQSKTNTATVIVYEAADGEDGEADLSNTKSGSDTSVVRTAVPPLPPSLSLAVVKTNDANTDGSFNGTETAPSPGQDVAFRVVITNTSAVTVALSGLTDAVGGGVAVPVTCTVALPATLAAGASATCDFVLADASPAAGGSLADVAAATAHDPQDPTSTVTASGTSSVLTAQAPPNTDTADLAIVKTGPTTALRPGDAAGYSLAVTNSGTAPATSVVIDDIVPAGTTLTTLTATGFTCASVGVHCVYDGSLAVGATVSITVVLTLEATYSDVLLSNTGTVGPTDATPEDNSSTVVTDVVLPSPDLSIVKTGPDEVAPGDNLLWEVFVTNDGGAPAVVVEVTDVLPAGLILLSAAGAGWSCTGITTVSCSLDAPLAAGASASVVITALLAADYAADVVVNTVVVGPADVTPDDNTSTATTQVVVPITGGGGGTTSGGGFTGGGGGVVSGGVVGGGVVSGGALPVTGASLDLLGQLAPIALVAGLILTAAGRKRRTGF